MTDKQKAWAWIGVIGLTAALVIYNRKHIKKRVEQVADIILSAEQEVFIKKLHPLAQPVFRAFIKDVTDMGYKVVINSGYRTFQDQYTQWLAGLSDADRTKVKAGADPSKFKSKNAVAGRSGHNYGMAIDMNIYKDGKVWLKADPDSKWEATGIPKLAKEKYGMTWGGDLNGYQDAVHFDLSKKYGIDKLYNAAIKQYGNVQNAKGNEVKI